MSENNCIEIIDNFVMLFYLFYLGDARTSCKNEK